MTATAGIPVHVSDDTFVAAAPPVVAAAVADPQRWAVWWPDLTLETTRDRGVKGHQWRVTGPVRGTAEIWLEPWRDGTVVHLYLRLDQPDAGRGGRGGRRAERQRRDRSLAWKRSVHAMKDELESGRHPGDPAVPPH